MDALKGITLTLRTPRLWGLCALPLFLAVAAYIALGIAGGFLLAPRLPVWLSRWGVGGGGWVAAGSEIFVVVLWIVLFPFLFTLLAGVFGGLIFDRLSLAVEEIEAARTGTSGAVPRQTLPFRAALGDSVARLFCNVLLGGGALALGVVLGPVAGVCVAAVVGLLDCTAPAHARRGRTLGAQSAFMRGALRRAPVRTLSFALVAGLLSLAPFVGVFFLPGLVAGGTLLTRDLEQIGDTQR